MPNLFGPWRRIKWPRLFFIFTFFFFLIKFFLFLYFLFRFYFLFLLENYQGYSVTTHSAQKILFFFLVLFSCLDGIIYLFLFSSFHLILIFFSFRFIIFFSFGFYRQFPRLSFLLSLRAQKKSSLVNWYRRWIHKSVWNVQFFCTNATLYSLLQKVLYFFICSSLFYKM